MSQSTQRTTDVEADRALKTKHRAMWALGDYPAVATEVIPELGPVLVEAAGVRPGDRVLDVAAGSGNVAVRPRRRADVVACDLTPELFDAGRAARRRRGRRGRVARGRRGEPALRRRTPSTRCCPASASCSHRTTRPRPTSSCASAGPAARSG